MAESSAADIEMGRLNANTTLARGPQHFFQEISEFGVLLNNTTNLVKKLKEASLEFSSVTGSDAMKEIKRRMEKDLNEVGEMAHVMKEKLDRIFPSALTPILNNLPNGRRYSVTLATTMGPSTKSMVRALKKKFKGTKKDLENLRKTIWKEYLQVVQRRTFTVAGIKLSDEVIRAVDAGSVVQMFENALQGIHPEQVVPAVDEIKERHAAVMDFDKKITELQQNFAEMAALVETRQKIDRALNEVQKALTRARSTDEELRYERTESERLFAVVIFLGLLLLLCFLW